MSVGLEIARARQEKQLSREELATRTGLSAQSIAAIEDVDADRLPDILHLRACVGVLAEEVGLDPDLTSERYMARLKHRSALDEFLSESAEVSPVRTGASRGSTSGNISGRERRASKAPLWIAWMRPASLTYGALAVVTLITLATGMRLIVTRRLPTRDLAPHAPALPLAITVDVTPPVETVAPSQPRDLGELSGMWMLTSNVERSSKETFSDLMLGFRLQLDHTGNRIIGHGVKWTENGRRLASRARTPIIVEGTIEDGRLALTFTEHGIRRISHGTFELQQLNDGSLRGRFSTNAAQSSGRVQAIRLAS